MQVQSLGREDLLEDGTATHSSNISWRIPWREEPGGLQSIATNRVGPDWSNLAIPAHMDVKYWLRVGWKSILTRETALDHMFWAQIFETIGCDIPVATKKLRTPGSSPKDNKIQWGGSIFCLSNGVTFFIMFPKIPGKLSISCSFF